MTISDIYTITNNSQRVDIFGLGGDNILFTGYVEDIPHELMSYSVEDMWTSSFEPKGILRLGVYHYGID